MEPILTRLRIGYDGRSGIRRLFTVALTLCVSLGVVRVSADDQTTEGVEATEETTPPVESNPVAESEEQTPEPTDSASAPAPAPAAATEPQPVPPPVTTDTAPIAPPPQQPVRRKKGLMIAGIATFGGGYLFSALVGYLLYSEATVPKNAECLNCQTAGGRMFIPLVGPFLAIPVARKPTGPVVAGAMGGVQVIGATLAVIGIVQYVNSGKEAQVAELGRERDALSRLRLSAGPDLTGGGTVSFGWIF